MRRISAAGRRVRAEVFLIFSCCAATDTGGYGGITMARKRNHPYGVIFCYMTTVNVSITSEFELK